MKRAFLSLFLLIVLATLGLGWALDQLWTTLQSGQEPRAPGAVLTETLDLASLERPLSDTRDLVYHLAEQGVADVRLLPLEDLSGESVKQRLTDGETLSFEDGKGHLYHYRKLTGHPQVLVVGDVTPQSPQWFEALLAVVFYSALAAVIFFWLWPLTRDLDRLEQHAGELGRDPEAPLVELTGRSAAGRLGRAFNRMARRIRDLMRSQREMTHAVSHELRTPLARMKFALEMAESSRNPDTVHQQIQSLRADVSEMDQLIDQLLHYARFERQPELHRAPGDMEALLRDLWHRLSAHRPDRPALHLHSDGLHAPMVCDWVLMERVLHNVLQNALRYARERIDVTLISDAHHAQLSIEDDGPGIPPEDRQRIFEAFVRLRETPEQAGAGFGLGLAIVFRVMQWHGGKVEVDNPHRGGARFTLHWPRGEA